MRRYAVADTMKQHRVLVALERESVKLHSGFRERICAAAEVQQCYDLSGAWETIW
jgi:hypothetical protein